MYNILMVILFLMIISCKDNIREEIVKKYDDGKPKLIEYSNQADDNKELEKGIEYYLDGKIKSEKHFKHGKKNGKWTTYYENGQIKSEEYYSNGSSEGKWTYYNKGGSIDEVKEYKFDKLINETSYFMNGNNKIMLSYNQLGLFNEKEWYENGMLKSEDNLNADLKIKTENEYYQTGATKTSYEQYFKIKQTNIKKFYENGNMYQHMFVSPSVTIVKDYALNMNLITKTEFWSDSTSIVTSWNDDGTPSDLHKRSIKTINGKSVRHRWEEWYEDGNRKSQDCFDAETRKNCANEESTEWYENGQIKQQTFWDENGELRQINMWKKEGKMNFTFYYENDTLIKTINHSFPN